MKDYYSLVYRKYTYTIYYAGNKLCYAYMYTLYMYMYTYMYMYIGYNIMLLPPCTQKPTVSQKIDI